ncbi:MAG: hypothetical protein N4A61_05545 [Pelagimonas sp.]|jgi:hypothetical protein|nr:hypothetical protein [Pelagimonas sp.]
MTRFEPDRKTYVQSHTTMAALAMGIGMVVLWMMDNPHVWTGAIGGLAAVALRGWYLMDEELSHTWEMSGDTLSGPAGRVVPLTQIAEVKSIGSAVQIITRAGDKHLIKFQADPQGTITRIKAAQSNSGEQA